VINSTSPLAIIEPTASGTIQEAVQAALDSVTSPNTRRAYKRAMLNFLAWGHANQRGQFNAPTVRRYAADQLQMGRGVSAINQELSAIRLFAAMAAEVGLITNEEARGIEGVKSFKKQGSKLGNWLTAEQATALLQTPDTSTLKGLRDRAILAVLLGCGLRRHEAAGLTISHVQMRAGRWVIVNLVGKGNKTRSVPMPGWAKAAVQAWTEAAGIADGYLFRPLNKAGRLAGEKVSVQTVWNVVMEHANTLGLNVAPHDLRRTFARLALDGGAEMKQIQYSLGHASVQTTEVYVGNVQNLEDAPGDRLGIAI
jgi:site-specific recombinase XerD